MLLSAQGDLDLPRITVIGKQSAGNGFIVGTVTMTHVPFRKIECRRGDIRSLLFPFCLILSRFTLHV